MAGMLNVRNILLEIERAHINYFQNKIILKAVKEAAFESEVNTPEITQRVQHIIAASDLAKFMVLNLEENISEQTILGLEEHHKDITNVVLSFSEKMKFHSIVEEKLLENCSRVQQLKWKKGDRSGTTKDIFSPEKRELESTANQFLKWYEAISEYKDLIKELLELRMELSETFRSEIVPWLEIRSECLDLEARVLERKIMVHMFSENSSMPEAAKLVHNNLKNEHDERQTELEILKANDEAYQRLRETEYSDILEEYKRVKKDLTYNSWLVAELVT